MKTSAKLPSAIEGRTAIVTGAAGFLGSAIAEALAARGGKVVGIDARPAPAGVGYDRHYVCDLLDVEGMQRIVDEVGDDVGPISILVNAAGLIHSAALIDLSANADPRPDLDQFRRVIDANLSSVFVTTSLVVRRMVSRRTKGAIISLSSIAAQGNAGQSAYAAAKAGLNAMTASWSKELGPLGIRFVAVAPGFIDTPSTSGAMADAILEEWVRKTPTRSLGTRDDVVSAVVFAIENRHLTAAVLPVDGGLVV